MPDEGRKLSRRDPLHMQVARNIRNDIEAGVIRDGQVLPATRVLAERWGVSVFTINEAMKVLAGEGLVVNEARSRRTVRAPEVVPSDRRWTTPHVVLVGGYAGSGKTEFGRTLAREAHWPILDKDTLTRPVVESALALLGLSPNDRESDRYISEVRPREYESLMAAMTENLDCGNSAIVTAPFIREFSNARWLARVADQIAAASARMWVVWMACDVDTMHTYVRHRGAARDAAKLSGWSDYVATIDPDFRPLVEHVVVDNSSSARPLRDQAGEFLGKVGGVAASG
jgi:DNA-binding transcriptional regulator YhcF (GntR family)/predicted kinase